MQFTQRDITINTSGYVDRLERGFAMKREVTHFQHVLEPVIIPRPQMEDFNSLVVVHDKVEQYL